MTFLAPKNKSLSAIFIILVTLTISLTTSANTGDWGMVEQFNKKSELAAKGNINAMYDLGKLYERGRGVNKNISKAVEWFQKAASAGHAYSQARLGVLYFEGRGVKQNYNKALKLLNAAAKKNVSSAYYQLANMFELGTGVKQDLNKSIIWYKKAEKAGYYLAIAKVERLQKRLKSNAIKNNNPSSQAGTKTTKVAHPLIQTILRGRWLKRKSAVGYLPSLITNCALDSGNSMHCISTSQERSTGTEVITYNTESMVTANNAKSFNIIYTNNVLEVALLEAVDGDGEVIEKSSSRIKTGKQGKKRKLTCRLKNNKTITCSKNTSNFNLVSQ